MLSSATRSEAILPGVVRSACSHDGPDAHAQRRNASATSPDSPGASRYRSMPKAAVRAPVPLPKQAGGWRCVAGVWVGTHALAFGVGLVRVAAPAPKQLLMTR